VLYEADAPVARIVLDWPQRANAQSSDMVWQVDQALDLAEHDSEIKVVVLKAHGKGFCAGHLIAGCRDAYPEFVESDAAIGSSWIGSRRLFLWPTLRFYEFPKPMIAQVRGYCLGGGTYWAYLPDITIASEDAYFQMPLAQGLGSAGGETMVEPWTFMNRKRAAEYLYTAQTLSAEEALAMGLINRVVPRDDLESAVETMAAHIARAPLSTLMAAKSLLIRAWDLMGMRQHLQMSADIMSVLEKTSDAVALRRELAQRGSRPRQMAAERGEDS
jgi:enoyl-CoA hydratase/carnithine racemase